MIEARLCADPRRRIETSRRSGKMSRAAEPVVFA
jgi:hypothetical protein